MMKYLLIEFLNGDDSKWELVKKYILPLASHVEFNILYSGKELDEFLKYYEDSVKVITKKKGKIYQSGKVMRLPLSEKVIKFINEKTFSDFKNTFIEDPSFYIDDIEVIGSISHEDQIYLRPDYIDLSVFKDFKLEHRIEEEKNEIGFIKRIANLFCRE